MTFLPADSEDGQIIYLLHFLGDFFGIACWHFFLHLELVVPFFGFFWHCMLTFLLDLELPVTFFEICVHFLTFLSNRAL